MDDEPYDFVAWIKNELLLLLDEEVIRIRYVEVIETTGRERLPELGSWSTERDN